jgi:hypothetical protein
MNIELRQLNQHAGKAQNFIQQDEMVSYVFLDFSRMIAFIRDCVMSGTIHSDPGPPMDTVDDLVDASYRFRSTFRDWSDRVTPPVLAIAEDMFAISSRLNRLAHDLGRVLGYNPKRRNQET